VTDTSFEYLSLADLSQVAGLTLGSYQVREPGLLALAVARPRMSAFGADAYPSLADKGGALMHSLARNHPLVDGNKRLAFMAGWTFFAVNGWRLTPPNVDQGEDMVLRLARGELAGADLSEVLQQWLTRR